jgi:N6-L-threonylcarbamoyladenine synthase
MNEHGFLEKRTTHHSLNRAFNGVFPFLISSCHEISLARNFDDVMKCPDSGTITKVCYTAGPGQQQSLCRGFTLAKILASSLRCKLIPVHHMEGHIYSADLPRGEYPFLAILLSGGHTLIVLVTSSTEYTILSRSVDDNIGEAFDKIAREFPFSMRGNEYGGRIIENYAKICSCDKSSWYETTNRPNVSLFSYSGIKSEVFKDISATSNEKDYILIACKFQRSVLRNLREKLLGCMTILTEMHIRPAFISLGGGVSLNESIRETIKNFAESEGLTAYLPCKELSTDNASMVAKACSLANLAQRSFDGQLNPIAEFPLGFIKDDDAAVKGYIST